jgi:protein O-GlcNAc transferase
MAPTKFSLFELLPDLPMLEILDVGAAALIDQAPCYADLVNAGHGRVTGFEPDLAGCVALNQRFGRPHRFFPKFVGTGQPAKFYETNTPFTGSLYPPNQKLLALFSNLDEVTRLERVRDVETVRIDDIPDIEDVDFFKIDVQGSELDVFRGAERALDAAVLVQTEVEFVEIYRGQPLFADIDAHLRSRGFWFHDFIGLSRATFKPRPTVVPRHERQALQTVWSDAIYVKDPQRLDVLSDVKLLKLAALLHDLYGSHDFAHFFLQAADARCGGQAAPRYMARLCADD